jgi:hypothetical protein
MNERIEVDCPRCGGHWYNDLDETGTPYTCYHCCNGTLKCYEDECGVEE